MPQVYLFIYLFIQGRINNLGKILFSAIRGADFWFETSLAKMQINRLSDNKYV